MNFVHLHVHSHYSMLDGLSKIDPLIETAVEYGMPAIALTDHGNLYGAIEFYQKAKKAGIKPILGMEAYMARGSMRDKNPGIDDKRYHLTLLAKNIEGWKNLIKLATEAHLNGFYYKPRIDKELLYQHSRGLIGLSGCVSGEIPRALLSGDSERAEELLNTYQDIFGKDDFYIELEHHPNIPNHNNVQKMLLEFAKKHNVKVVATQDSHYIKPEDAKSQDVLLAIQTNSRLDDEDRLTMKEDDFSFADPQKMSEAFRQIPDAVDNTLAIADKVNIDIRLGQVQLPDYALPEGETDESYLKKCAFEGLKMRYKNNVPEEAVKRLNFELDVIAKTGFSTYFLVVEDLVRWAKQKGIVVGPGRGSAAGSLISYTLGITQLNPLEYKLFFERFMNPERISPPDIDLDFADTRRDEVIKYTQEKYGHDHVAQIITFGTMAARGAIRDAGRALGMPYQFCDEVAKKIPFSANLIDKTNYLAKCLKTIPELKSFYETNSDAKKLIDAARELEGTVRHASTHASGVVITKEPLTNIVPLQSATNSKTEGNEILVTQFGMKPVEDLGLLKIDFLGLANLSIIEETLIRIKQRNGKEIDIGELEVNDPDVFKTLAEGKTVGVFQLESSGMTHFLKELKPTDFEDIIAMISLYRPGTLDAGMIPRYIARKHGQEKVHYLHPKLEPVLKNTYGIMLYQEQLMQVAQAMAGFTLSQADTLRKAVGKKIRKLMLEQKEKFMTGVEKNTGSKQLADQLWTLIEPFERYGFNRSHAACYAMLAYQTAWLKTYYPVEFMTSLLNAESKNLDRMSFLIAECNNESITVLPPNINESDAMFAMTDERSIRFGLSAIKNVGHNVVDAIIRERLANNKYTSLADLIERVRSKDLNKKSIEALCKSGALDALEERNMILKNMDKILAYAHEGQENNEKNQDSLFGLMQDKTTIPELRLEKAETVSDDQKLRWEKELLGLYVSGHPLQKYLDNLSGKYSELKSLKTARSGMRVRTVCMLSETKRFITKTGEPMLFVKLQDKTDELEGVVFPSTLKAYEPLLRTSNCLIIDGKVNERNGAKSLICDKVQILKD